jgi:hypothetical protein
MATELNAKGYSFTESNYAKEFKQALCGIYACYTIMLSDNVSVPNDENAIRDILLIKYLKNNAVREKTGLSGNFIFDREVPEDYTDGRTDIKVQTLQAFLKSEAYYVIECKRLDNKNQTGKTGLNGEYISNGISRFVSGKYSTYEDTSGMIGFVVSQMDIHENIGFINQLLRTTFTDINTETELTKKQITPDFEYSYFSSHNVGNVTKTIYHLMFDFSGNVNNEIHILRL